ncbi:hypothetical protein SK128_010984 [Halocaridina rubra]|uniref:Uncharacterized protein n=1 Tax=Halocaridina rubra TaxID=373956 RepID=A0AAN9AF51_HALRR
MAGISPHSHGGGCRHVGSRGLRLDAVPDVSLDSHFDRSYPSPILAVLNMGECTPLRGAGLAEGGSKFLGALRGAVS